MNLVAITAFGLESFVKHELTALGFPPSSVDNGRVFFDGDPLAIAQTNLQLRVADRIQIVLSRFRSEDFDSFFEGIRSVAWKEFIPANARIVVAAHSTKSTLRSAVTCQAMAKKAITGVLLEGQTSRWLKETGSDVRIDIGIRNNDVTIALDTSGAGLHKRGYRLDTVEAPLRETLAAAMIIESRWNPSRILADPFCGSGTIAIEAALIGRRIAPGIRRSFAAENWPWIPGTIWKEARAKAREAEIQENFHILASDIDYFALKAAEQNAERAGVARNIRFQKKPASEFRSRKAYGCLVSNPPYGERIGDRETSAQLYRDLKAVFSNLDRWSAFILSGHEDFQKHFGRCSKNRKLYNSTIRCYLYEYLGALPPIEKAPLPGDDPAGGVQN